MLFRSCIGIDPGITTKSFAYVYSHVGTPVLEKYGEYKYATLVSVLMNAKEPCLIAVEKASASPQMGVTSAFNYGEAYGKIISDLERIAEDFKDRNIGLIKVPPASWKSTLGLLKKPKNASVKKVQNLFRHSEKISHHEADAALIAYASLDFMVMPRGL